MVPFSLALPLGAATPGEAAGYSEYYFYQPQQYSQGAYYWAAYLRLWSTGQFDLWEREEQTYHGALGQCDQVRLYTSHGNKYTASSNRITFPGSATYTVNDNCTPSQNLHKSGPDTMTWSYRQYQQSPTWLEFANKSYSLPFNDFVFKKCVPNTNCQQLYK
jgi:hypothetical protein